MNRFYTFANFSIFFSFVSESESDIKLEIFEVELEVGLAEGRVDEEKFVLFSHVQKLYVIKNNFYFAWKI